MTDRELRIEKLAEIIVRFEAAGTTHVKQDALIVKFRAMTDDRYDAMIAECLRFQATSIGASGINYRKEV